MSPSISRRFSRHPPRTPPTHPSSHGHRSDTDRHVLNGPLEIWGNEVTHAVHFPHCNSFFHNRGGRESATWKRRRLTGNSRCRLRRFLCLTRTSRCCLQPTEREAGSSGLFVTARRSLQFGFLSGAAEVLAVGVGVRAVCRIQGRE